MTVIGINGSPRKTWNTATLLEKALEGAASQGAETGIVHLYDLDFQGCTSCFACKLEGGKKYGRCAVKDDLTPILDAIAEADALVLGSPIYFGNVTGEMRSFLERLLFPYLVYSNPPSSLFRGELATAFIYTMNAPEEYVKTIGYTQLFAANEQLLGRIFKRPTETLCSFETLQFPDNSKVVFSYADPEERKERRRTVFPQDCEKAFALGARLAASRLSAEPVAEECGHPAQAVEPLSGFEGGGENGDRRAELLGLLHERLGRRVMEEPVHDQHLLGGTESDRSSGLGHAVGDRAIDRDAADQLLDKPHLASELTVTGEPIEDPLADRVLDSASPYPAGIKNGRPLGEGGETSFQVCGELLFHEPRPGDDEGALKGPDEVLHPVEEGAATPAFVPLGAAGRHASHKFGAILPNPVELRLALLEREDVHGAEDGGPDSPFDPLKVSRPPGADHRELGVRLQVDRVIGPEFWAVFDRSSDPEAGRGGVELNPLDPDAKPDRALLCLLGAKFVGRRLDRTKRGGKDERPRNHQVREMPEVVERFRDEPALPIPPPKLAALSLHGPRRSQTPRAAQTGRLLRYSGPPWSLARRPCRPVREAP